jgi:GNAT superfamily N-acetyltransferase
MSKMKYRIREARRADGPAIVELQRQLDSFLGEPTQHFTVATLERDALGPDPWIEIRVAEDEGGQLIGYALHHDSYETAYAARGIYVADIHVVESARRQGVARALLAAVARSGRARGATYLWWNSKVWNTQAHAAYDALGATKETVVAHAIVAERFERLAEI